MSNVRLSQISGVYLNKGDPSTSLSEHILGYVSLQSKFKHEDIKCIDVEVRENTLLVSAITEENCIAYQSDYEQGRDFEIENDKIVLFSDTNLMSRGAGDVLAGPSYERRYLSLDIKNNAVFKSEAYMAGLIFMLVPIAASEEREVRFTKISNGDATFKVCGNH